MLAVALIGFGKMGKMIQDMAPAYGLDVVSIFDPCIAEYALEINPVNLRGAQVCIDFSHPDAVLENCRQVAACGVNIVIGTTGWNSSEVQKIADEQDIGILYGSNFSIGMNTFYLIVEETARLFAHLPEYDPYGIELHHNQKKDSPSGTAKDLAQIIVQQIPRKTDIEYTLGNRKVEAHEFVFSSVRAGAIPGTHTIGFDSAADTIELTHTVRNRSSLALGAIKGALWLAHRKGLYQFRQVFAEIAGL